MMLINQKIKWNYWRSKKVCFLFDWILLRSLIKQLYNLSVLRCIHLCFTLFFIKMHVFLHILWPYNARYAQFQLWLSSRHRSPTKTQCTGLNDKESLVKTTWKKSKNCWLRRKAFLCLFLSSSDEDLKNIITFCREKNEPALFKMSCKHGF